jgi:hypothetical protein
MKETYMATKVQTKAKPGVGNLTVLADWVRDNMFQAHRGAFLERGRLIVFDNGGVGHPWGVHELELTLAWLRKHGVTVHGMATCSDCHTWVLVAEGVPDSITDAINVMLWDAWRKVVGAENDPGYDLYRVFQYRVTLETILERPRVPTNILKELSRTKSK